MDRLNATLQTCKIDERKINRVKRSFRYTLYVE